MKKILFTIIITSILILPVFFINAQANKKTSISERPQPISVNGQVRSATEAQIRIENRVEMRNTNMEQVKARIASTTQRMENRIASTSDRLAKQREQMNQVRERLLNREFQAITVLEQIANKIQIRIDILISRGLDMNDAQNKLNLAIDNIAKMTNKASDITTELETEITFENKAEIFAIIRASHEEIRMMAKETHALLIETVKEINKMLPLQNRTATSTNN